MTPTDPEQAAARVRFSLEAAERDSGHEDDCIDLHDGLRIRDLRALLAERDRLREDNERLRGERAIADNARLHAELLAARAAATQREGKS